MNGSPIPVTLLTGFLGSGKTTLLDRLLRQVPLTAVLMNEFGEIGLDRRKLPRLSQKLKVELSGLFPPGGSDEDFEVHRDADRLDPQAV